MTEKRREYWRIITLLCASILFFLLYVKHAPFYTCIPSLLVIAYTCMGRKEKKENDDQA